MRGRMFEIVVRGGSFPAVPGPLPGFDVVARGAAPAEGPTVLRGWVVDQSALYGALDRIADLGYELEAVRPCDPSRWVEDSRG